MQIDNSTYGTIKKGIIIIAMSESHFLCPKQEFELCNFSLFLYYLHAQGLVLQQIKYPISNYMIF